MVTIQHILPPELGLIQLRHRHFSKFLIGKLHQTGSIALLAFISFLLSKVNGCELHQKVLRLPLEVRTLLS